MHPHRSAWRLVDPSFSQVDNQINHHRHCFCWWWWGVEWGWWQRFSNKETHLEHLTYFPEARYWGDDGAGTEVCGPRLSYLLATWNRRVRISWPPVLLPTLTLTWVFIPPLVHVHAMPGLAGSLLCSQPLWAWTLPSHSFGVWLQEWLMIKA